MLDYNVRNLERAPTKSVLFQLYSHFSQEYPSNNNFWTKKKKTLWHHSSTLWGRSNNTGNGSGKKIIITIVWFLQCVNENYFNELLPLIIFIAVSTREKACGSECLHLTCLLLLSLLLLPSLPSTQELTLPASSLHLIASSLHLHLIANCSFRSYYSCKFCCFQECFFVYACLHFSPSHLITVWRCCWVRVTFQLFFSFFFQFLIFLFVRNCFAFHISLFL